MDGHHGAIEDHEWVESCLLRAAKLHCGFDLSQRSVEVQVDVDVAVKRRGKGAWLHQVWAGTILRVSPLIPGQPYNSTCAHR
jgi:hypothetical protein